VDIIEMSRAHEADVCALLEQLSAEIGFTSMQRLAQFVRARTLDDRTSPPELLLLAAEGSTLSGFCFGAMRSGQGVVKLFGTRPGARRRGFASTLLAELERRMVAQGAREVIVGGVGPLYFVPGVDVGATPAITFLMQRGYASDRTCRVDMRVDLAEANLDTSAAMARLGHEGLAIRRATPEDVVEAASFAQAQFSDVWRHEVSDSALYSPIPLFVARNQHGVVSFAAYDVGGYGRFGPTGTRPDYRHRGIGSLLLKLCLADMRARGDAIADISWAGPLDFYSRSVGARNHRAFWAFRKALAGASG